eukprot:sb/3471109/
MTCPIPLETLLATGVFSTRLFIVALLSTPPNPPTILCCVVLLALASLTDHPTLLLVGYGSPRRLAINFLMWFLNIRLLYTLTITTEGVPGKPGATLVGPDLGIEHGARASHVCWWPRGESCDIKGTLLPIDSKWVEVREVHNTHTHISTSHKSVSAAPRFEITTLFPSLILELSSLTPPFFSLYLSLLPE